MKLMNGRCLMCDKILPDDAKPIDGYPVCSDECAYDKWLNSVA